MCVWSWQGTSLQQFGTVSSSFYKSKERKARQNSPTNPRVIKEWTISIFQSLIRYHKHWCVCEGVWADWNRDRELVGRSWCNWYWSELWGFWRISANSHSPPVCPLFRCLWHSHLSTFTSPQPPFCVWCWEFMRGEWSCESLCVSIVHVYLL